MGAIGAGLSQLPHPLAPMIAHGEAWGLQSAFGGDSLWAGGPQSLPLLLQMSLHPPCYSPEGSPEADIAEDGRKARRGEVRGE